VDFCSTEIGLYHFLHSRNWVGWISADQKSEHKGILGTRPTLGGFLLPRYPNIALLGLWTLVGWISAVQKAGCIDFCTPEMGLDGFRQPEIRTLKGILGRRPIFRGGFLLPRSRTLHLWDAGLWLGGFLCCGNGIPVYNNANDTIAKLSLDL